MEAAILKFRVYPTDLDVFKHVNNGNYLRMMDLGRTYLLIRNKSLLLMLRKGYFPVVTTIHIDFIKEMKLWQKFELKTKLAYWDDKNFYMIQKFIVNDKVMSRAYVKGLIRRGKKKVAPSEFVELMGQEDKPPIKPDWVDFLQKTTDSSKVKSTQTLS